MSKETKLITVQGVKELLKEMEESMNYGYTDLFSKKFKTMNDAIDQFHDAELPSEKEIIAKVESFAKAQSKTVPDRHGDLKKGYYWGMSDAINYIKSKTK